MAKVIVSFFPVNMEEKEKDEEEEEKMDEEEEIRTRMQSFHSNATELYSWAKAIVSFK